MKIFENLHKEVPAIIHIKSNAGTLGCTKEGCKKLSRHFNIFVGENKIAELGPFGAVGSCSSLVYQNPKIILNMFGLLKQKRWKELRTWTDKIEKMIVKGLKPAFERGCLDSALDRLLGKSAGFLKTSLRCRGPYPSCTKEHLEYFKDWLKKNYPEFLELE